MREPPSLKKESRSPAFRLEVLTLGHLVVFAYPCALNRPVETPTLRRQWSARPEQSNETQRHFRTPYIAFALLSLCYLQEVRYIGGHRAIVIILARGRRLLRRLWRRGRLRRFGCLRRLNSLFGIQTFTRTRTNNTISSQLVCLLECLNSRGRFAAEEAGYIAVKVIQRFQTTL